MNMNPTQIVRVECLKIAVEARRGGSHRQGLVETAREMEQYVLETPEAAAEPEKPKRTRKAKPTDEIESKTDDNPIE